MRPEDDRTGEAVAGLVKKRDLDRHGASRNGPARGGRQEARRMWGK
jgi:hypothetical protein